MRVEAYKRIIVVLSLDKLLCLNQLKKLEAFEVLCKKQKSWLGSVIDLNWEQYWSMACLVWDEYRTGYINRYNKGELSSSAFRKAIASLLGYPKLANNTKEQAEFFWNAWNHESINARASEIKYFLGLQQEIAGLEFVVVGITNAMQYNYIANNLEENGIDLSMCHSIFSFEEGELDLAKLAHIKLAQLNLSKDDVVISLAEQFKVYEPSYFATITSFNKENLVETKERVRNFVNLNKAIFPYSQILSAYLRKTAIEREEKNLVSELIEDHFAPRLS